MHWISALNKVKKIGDVSRNWTYNEKSQIILIWLLVGAEGVEPPTLCL